MQHPQQELLMILVRDVASRLATAVFVVDPEGTLVYFNEAAERVLGQPFVEGHPMPAEDWSSRFRPCDEHGDPLPLAELPLGVALQRREPSHRGLSITGADGVLRGIEVTAFPLFARTDEFVGAVAIFWQPEAG